MAIRVNKDSIISVSSLKSFVERTNDTIENVTKIVCESIKKQTENLQRTSLSERETMIEQIDSLEGALKVKRVAENRWKAFWSFIFQWMYKTDARKIDSSISFVNSTKKMVQNVVDHNGDSISNKEDNDSPINYKIEDDDNVRRSSKDLGARIRSERRAEIRRSR